MMYGEEDNIASSIIYTQYYHLSSFFLGQYELLRRSPMYEIRRYPSTINIETIYDKRPDGYDCLGSYASGSNEDGRKISYYSPTLMTINDIDSVSENRIKTMSWPLMFAMVSYYFVLVLIFISIFQSVYKLGLLLYKYSYPYHLSFYFMFIHQLLINL